MARYPGFVGASYTSQSRLAADDRCMNFQVEKIESGTGAAPYVLYPTPGYETFCEFPKGPVRALYTLNGGTFGIGGDSLYELPTTVGGVPILRASGLTTFDNSQAMIVGNGDAGGNQLLITCGAKKYVFSLTNATTAPVLPTVPSGDYVPSVLPPTLTGTYQNIGGGFFNTGDAARYWAQTFVTAAGESLPSAKYASITGALGAGGPYHFEVFLPALPDGAVAVGVTNRKIYRTLAGGTQLKFVATIGLDALQYTDNVIDDAHLGGNAPSSDTSHAFPFASGDAPRSWAYTFVTASGESLPGPLLTLPTTSVLPAGGPFYFTVKEIDTGPASVTARNIYRTVAGGTQLKLSGTLVSGYLNGGRVLAAIEYVDEVLDANLGANAPTVDTASVTTTGLTLLTGAATQCGFLDGYGIVLDPARSEFRLSNLNNFAIFNAIDVAQRSDAADKWQAMLVHHQGKELWLFGSQTTAVWYNSGAPPPALPFTPNPNVFIPIGITGPFSAAVLDGSPIWLGTGVNGGGVVYRAVSYNAQRVSTHAVEYAFSTYATLEDARGFVYEEQGHSVYVLTFPTAGHTWAFDGTTGMWHERGVWNGWDYEALPIVGHVFALGRHLVGSTTDGKVYQMASDVMTGCNGEAIRRMRRAPHVHQDGLRLAVDRFQLDMEVGLGLPVGQGSDPQVSLRWSNDGGQTWVPDLTISAGKVGEYHTRAIWKRLGMARDRVFEVSVSEPVPIRIIDAFVDVRTGT
jgi:hypothetical protein